MNRLPKLKEWFLLDDAAKELSKILAEDWTVHDVIQLVLEGHLFLSWNVMVKGGLSAGIDISELDMPIQDSTLIKPLRGQYKIVL